MLTKLYNYILDQSSKNDNGEKRLIPEKLSDYRFGDMGKIVDNDNKQLPGKLKNSFYRQDKNEDDKNRIITRKKKSI